MNAAWLLRVVCVVVVAVPLVYAMASSLHAALAAQAWVDLFTAPGVLRAWSTSVATAVVSTVVAALLAWHLVARWVQPAHVRPGIGPDMGSGTRSGTGFGVGLGVHSHSNSAARDAQAWLGPMLAMPHAAFAVGLMVLLAPAGWVARLLAWPLAWTQPPDGGVLVDSPLALVVVLIAKELPFLLWNLLASMRRPDVQRMLVAADQQAALLGHSASRRWWLVHAPMHARRLAWPVLAVLAYGLAVVDVPLVTGPTLPPPLAVLAWEGIVDADPARQATGAAAAWLLAATLMVLALLAAWLMTGAAHALAAHATKGPAVGAGPKPHGKSEIMQGVTPGVAHARCGWALLLLVYAAVGLALVLASFAGPWPFPQLLPSLWTDDAWLRAWEGAPRIGVSLLLAVLAASASVVLVVAWLASTPPRWDGAAVAAAMATMLVPSMLLALGLYELALRVRLDTTHAGVLWAHVLFACAYTLLVLAGPWRAVDRRYIDTARLLGHGAVSRLVRVQLPLLRAPLAAAWAVAFAVSLAQFLPTQLIGAGRITTLATEAVTLAASGQRNLAAATALLLAVLPCIVFVLASRNGGAQAAAAAAAPTSVPPSAAP